MDELSLSVRQKRDLALLQTLIGWVPTFKSLSSPPNSPSSCPVGCEVVKFYCTIYF